MSTPHLCLRLLSMCAPLLGLWSCQPGARAGGPARAPERVELVGRPDPAGPAGRGAPARSQDERARQGMLWYRIQPGPRALTIQLRLLRPPPRLSLFLPGAWAGRGDWADAIRIGRARGPDGPRAMTLRRKLGRLDIEAEQAAWIELEYEVALTLRRDTKARFEPQRLSERPGFFAYAPTFLILPSDRIARAMRQIPVELHAPSGWEIVTTWPKHHEAASRAEPDVRVHGYLVEDIRALRDAFVTGAPGLDERPIEEGRVVFEPEFGGDRDAFHQAIAETVRGYRTRYGDLGPVTALVRAPPGRRQSTRWGTGRRGGFVLELEPGAPLDARSRELIAHEAFHLWNGHALVPAPEHEANTRWFKEGLTQYVALRALHRRGQLGARALLDEIARAGSRCARRRAAGPQASASWRARYPYDRGLLLALGLDAALRHDTHGARTLDDWLGQLLDHARARPDWTYTPADLEATLLALAGPSGRASKLWHRLIRTDAPIPLEEHFAQIGLHWLTPDGTREAKLMPLAGQAHGWRALLAEETDDDE